MSAYRGFDDVVGMKWQRHGRCHVYADLEIGGDDGLGRSLPPRKERDYYYLV